MTYILIPFLLCCSSVLADLPREVKVSVEQNHSIAVFDSRTALGAGLDGHWQGETEKMFTPQNVKSMLGAGLGPVSIRLRTELAVEAWHWNPSGSWSAPKHRQGYWTSDTTSGQPIRISYGYKLPRRGNTLDEANDDGYSMLDDGDTKTFWKSDPYLTSFYTGELDSAHPQWVVLDFGKVVPIDSVRILWAEPYAKKFRVEYASEGRVYFGGHPWNVWKHFPWGTISNGKGGDQLLKLCHQAVMARYLRIWMTEGSGTALPGSTDPRDSFGYSIHEISAGERDSKGVFHDQVTHSPDHKQTLSYASSTDPWHRAIDRDPHVEQPGIDLIAQCGITRGLPLMLSIPVFYDTPENAAALATYTQKKGIPVGRFELGEEPDGQRIAPEDFGALYAQVARAMKKDVPFGSLLGGPSFVTVDSEKNDDTYRFNHNWWIKDFRQELARQGQAQNFQFLSFEWYPFDDVEEKESKQLPRAQGMLERAMKRLRPLGLPLVVGEANYSVFPCQQEVDLGGALLNAETSAQFLTMKGDTCYYYSYEPNMLEESSGSWGNQMMLMQGNRKGDAIPLASFYALRLMTREWMNPVGGQHQAFQVNTDLPSVGKNLASFFVLKRPDQTWSLLVINKDPTRSLHLFLPKNQFGGPCRLTTYAATEYLWKADGIHGHPFRNTPPTERAVSGNQKITIPSWSLSVLTSEKAN